MNERISHFRDYYVVLSFFYSELSVDILEQTPAFGFFRLLGKWNDCSFLLARKTDNSAHTDVKYVNGKELITLRCVELYCFALHCMT